MGLSNTYRQSPVKHQIINHKSRSLSCFNVNESEPIHLGPLETKAHTTNGKRTVYIYLFCMGSADEIDFFLLFL